MKKVFLLESDPLMFKAWEVRLKNSSRWELYALDNREDFEFRLEEFGPDLVVISEELADVKVLVTQIPVFVMGRDERRGEVILKKPIDLNELEGILDKLYAQISA